MLELRVIFSVYPVWWWLIGDLEMFFNKHGLNIYLINYLFVFILNKKICIHKVTYLIPLDFEMTINTNTKSISIYKSNSEHYQKIKVTHLIN